MDVDEDEDGRRKTASNAKHKKHSYLISNDYRYRERVRGMGWGLARKQKASARGFPGRVFVCLAWLLAWSFPPAHGRRRGGLWTAGGHGPNRADAARN